MKLTKEELSSLQELNSDYAKKKIQLGELEIQKYSMMTDISLLRAKFSQEEEKLIKKYGEDSVINLQTGEVQNKK